METEFVEEKENSIKINDLVTELLTESFIKDILRWYFNDDDIKILQIKINNLTAKGISFSSVLYRIEILLERNDNDQDQDQDQHQEYFHMITKIHPNGMTGITARKNKLFFREIYIYKEILPKIQEYLMLVNDFTKISPKCFYTTENPESIILLEDMKAMNFRMFEHGRLLNLEHVLLVIEKLAILHATSVLIYENYPSIMNFLREGPISSNPNRQDFLQFFPANMRSLANVVSKWSGYEEIAKKLYKLEKTIIPKAIELFENDDKTRIRVLNLGDLWINNLLFRYNDDTKIPEDVVMFDYQLAYFGSPAIDLNYFLFGSVNENVRKVHFKFIIREYHRHLKDTFEKLNYTGYIPSLKDIHIEIIDKSLHGVIAAVCLTPIIFMEIDKHESLDGLFQPCAKGDKLRMENIKNPKYEMFIKKTLKEFELSGFLD